MRIKKSISKNNYITYSIIKDYTNSKGKRTTCIYETLGNMDKLIERFGADDTLSKVQEYVDSLNNKIKEGKELPALISLDPNKRIEKGVNREFNAGHIYLRKIYYDLGIDKICKNIKDKYNFTFDINSIVECLVYARIIWPSSKLSTYEQSKKFLGNYNLKLHHIYRALTYLSKEIDIIQKDLFNYSNKVIGRNYNVIYYDCTNYFFYTEEDDFKKYGISKQHQPLPLVQMGLFMDADGYPVAMNINPGNTAEVKTMIPTEEEIIKNYNIDAKKIVVCTDAAMCTDDIKKFNVNKAKGFVITQPIKKLKQELKNFALDKKGWHILGNLKDLYDLNEIEKDKDLKQQLYNTIFYKEIESESQSVKQALIVTFSFKYKDYHHKVKARQFEKAKELVEATNKKNKKATDKNEVEKISITKNPNDPKRFVKQIKTTDNGEVANNITYIVDESLYDKEEQYNGLYAITTNLMDDTKTILKVLGGRWEIEESFRIMKDEFDAGTVYLSREDRIKGHFITCFISLFIYRYLEHKLNDKYTVHQIVSELQGIKMLEQKGFGYQPIQTRSDLTDDLNDFLGTVIDNEIVTYKKIKKIFQEKT